MTVIVRLLLLLMIALSGQSLAFGLADAGIYSYDVFPNVSAEQSEPSRFRNAGYDALRNYPDIAGTITWAESYFASVDGFFVTKSADDIFKAGRTPKASELKKYAEGQGWKPTQTEGGPLKYVDENGIPRVTIKQGSSRAPGSGNPHVELKDATGQRIDPAGNPVTRRSPGNHTPIDYDL